MNNYEDVITLQYKYHFTRGYYSYDFFFYHSKDVLNDLFHFCCLFVFFVFFYNFDFKCIPPVKLT